MHAHWKDHQTCTSVATNVLAEFGARLVQNHNEKGYGAIDAEGGGEVYFPHEVVAGSHGFDDLRHGQTVEYTLEDGPYRRADFVSEVSTVPALGAD